MTSSGRFRLLPWVVFAILGPMAVLTRTDNLLVLATQGGVPEAGILRFQPSDMLGLRIGGPLVYGAVEWLLHGAARLMMNTPESSGTFLGTPWHTYAHGEAYVHGQLVPVLAVVLYRLLLLGAAIGLAARLFPTILARTLWVAAACLTLGGWPPMAVDAVFTLGGMIRDWPRAYYLFAHKLIFSDMAATAFVLGLAAWLARRPDPRLWQIAAAAALGQVVYEHFGLVTGIAVAVAALLNRDDPRPWRTAVIRLVVAGLAAAAVLAALLTLIGLRPGNGDGGGLLAQLQHQWEAYGRYNIAWWRVIVANLVSLATLPILAGILTGLACGRHDPAGQHDVRAVLAVMAGLVCAMGLGVVFSGFAADLGRQSVPLLMLILLASAKITQGWRSA